MSGDRRQKIVVIGASAAGLRAAARARRLMPDATITILDERSFISYGACGLPYYLSGDIDDLDKVRQTAYGQVRDADFFARVKGLDVQTRVRVVRFDPVAKQVFAVNLDTEDRPVYSYDKLVIATGARPRPLVGLQPGSACSFFHTPEEAMVLRKGLETGQISSVIVVGGGFIGVELAGAFGELWGCEVTVLEAMDRILPQLMDPDMAGIVAGQMRRQGVSVHTGKTVTRVVTEGDKAMVVAGGETFIADRVVVAVGVVPRVSWALDSGLETGPCGGVAVGDRLETNLPDVFAAGDCVEVKHRVSGCCALIPLGSLANRQGRVVGDNLAGVLSRFGPVTGSSCVKVFDWNVAATGLSVGSAKQAGLRPRSIWGTFTDRAHYYPEHEQLFLKLVYEEGTRRLLGMQACGPGQIIGRVDMLSSLLHQEGTLHDLTNLEHCYSPPFNSALEPLYVLGCAALNQEEGSPPGIGFNSPLDDYFTVDLRTAEEITEEYPSPPGALHLPLQELRERVDEVPRDRPLLLVCAMGTRSSEATRWLSTQGFTDLVYLAGGMNMRLQITGRHR